MILCVQASFLVLGGVVLAGGSLPTQVNSLAGAAGDSAVSLNSFDVGKYQAAFYLYLAKIDPTWVCLALGASKVPAWRTALSSMVLVRLK